MKKISFLLTAFLLSVSLMACGNQDNNNNKTDGNVNTDNNAANEDHQKMNNNEDGELDHQGNNMNGNDDTANDNNGNESKMEVADEAANRVSELEEVDTATVIVTDQNAYAAVVLKDNTSEELTDEMEGKIADEVRATDNNIQNVYVSLNPDFAQRLTDYGTRINEGEPIEGFFDEFTETVRNVFPHAH